jgi:hypothetical protein
VDWNGCSTTVFSRCRSKLLALRKQDTSGSHSSDASQQSAEDDALLLLLGLALPTRCAAAWLPACCFSAAAAAAAAAEAPSAVDGAPSAPACTATVCVEGVLDDSTTWTTQLLLLGPHLQRALMLPRS